jgi:hypothetical protein
MIVFEIAFVLINLAVPYWIWISSADVHRPKLDHARLRPAIERMIDTVGGFTGCETGDLVEAVDDLCEKSRLQWSADKGSVAIERAAARLGFACEVRERDVRLLLLPEENDEPDLGCVAVRPDMIRAQPEFRLDADGRLTAVEYFNAQGARRFIDARLCGRRHRPNPWCEGFKP